MDRSQIRAGRALLGWSQDDLSQASGVSLPTIKRIEPGEGLISASDDVLSKIISAMTGAGVVFIESDAESFIGGFGVRINRSNETSRLHFLLSKIDDAEQAIKKAIASAKGNDPVDDLREASAILARAAAAVAEKARYYDEFDTMAAPSQAEGR